MADDGALVGRILHPPGDGIVYGPGVVAGQLADLLSREGIGRPFVVTTGSVVRAGLVDGVLAALGVDAVGVFDGSREHTPAPVVLAAAAMARAADADGFVSVGGSSVVDLTKGVALVVAEGDERIGRRPPGGWPPVGGAATEAAAHRAADDAVGRGVHRRRRHHRPVPGASGPTSTRPWRRAGCSSTRSSHGRRRPTCGRRRG